MHLFDARILFDAPLALLLIDEEQVRLLTSIGASL